VTTYQPGDRVRHTWRNGEVYTGRVNRVVADDLYVVWDDGLSWLEYHVLATEVELIKEEAA
jgi:hypothetical protein